MRAWMLVCATWAAGCGAKTGLDVPIPICPELVPALATCTQVEIADRVVLEPPGAPRARRGAMHRVGDELLVHTTGDGSVTLHTLDAHGALLGSRTGPAPVPVSRVQTTGVAHSCSWVFSFHSAPLDEDTGITAPGRCVFWLEGAAEHRFLPGLYDRCYVAGIDEEGLRFVAERDGHPEELHVGLDGALRRYRALDEGPLRLFEVELPDGRHAEVRMAPTFDGVIVVSPDGVTTRIVLPFGASTLRVGPSLVWLDERGTLVSAELDAAGVPVLPPVLHPDLGADLVGLSAEPTPFGAWLLLQTRGDVVLIPVDGFLASLGAPLRLGTRALDLTVTDDGLVVLVEPDDGSLVALHLTCAA